MRERRRFERFKCLLGIRYRAVDGEEEGNCFSKDLSKGGMCLPLNEPLPVNRKMTIEIDLPDGSGKVIAQSTVKWCLKNRFHWESPYSAGVEFKNADPALLERLVNFARTHQWNKNDFEKALERRAIPIMKLKKLLFDWLSICELYL